MTRPPFGSGTTASKIARAKTVAELDDLREGRLYLVGHGYASEVFTLAEQAAFALRRAELGKAEVEAAR